MEYNIGDVIEDHRGHIRTISKYMSEWNGHEFWWTIGNNHGLRYYDIKRVLEKDEIDKIKNMDEVCRENIKKLKVQHCKVEKEKSRLQIKSNKLYAEMKRLGRTLVLDL